MKILEKISEIQFKNSTLILAIAIILTIFLGMGVSKISIQSDLNKMMPQDLEIYKIQDQIKDKFGGQDTSLILIRLEDTEKESIIDIRDPEVIELLVELQTRLSQEEMIEAVQSAGMIFTEETIPPTLDYVKQAFANIPTLDGFFNKDYSATIMVISSDLGGGEKKVIELEKKINEILAEVSSPNGVEIYVTGNPQIRTMILNLLVNDAVFTLVIASIIIFLLLIILQKSLTKAILVFIPLALGIVWTLGTMGWTGIELSIATVGIGAMILGLGVEYGVFIVSRYSEEREKNSAKTSLKKAVREVGSSVIGSGMTTVMGFLALTLSSMPMLRDLGISLAIGIAFSLLAAVLVNPAMIVLEEKFEVWKTEKQHDKLSKKKVHHERRKRLDEKDN